ncbi:hypothetical protein [Goodfellowiella coeruleoviolacea]|uniref:Uncharacterized protein n=1 Tax=Goodfellowiella coeruleoviolacea TaxID=334858 RepID=A0AAE3GIJ2_9PSEU|nr:hypothetical protein [Goodfellowiella coeruleoviolacea]MCP2166798.1 hypothetical protein [Goodfellowiella coeruleoviolacea]
MKVLVLGRKQEKLNGVLEVLRAEGFDGVGVTTDEEALALLDRGDIGAVIIGGGVGPEARGALKQLAGERDTTVIEGNLADRDTPDAVADYVRDQLLPRLR